MASVTNYAGSAAMATGGPGPTAYADWSNPGNATTSNNTYAEADATAVGIPGFSSRWLHATNFGFSIPSGATIDGIVVEWEGKSLDTSEANTISHVLLIKGGSRSGDNKGTGSWTTTSDEWKSFGGASDLWGNALTPTDVNSSSFGSAIAVTENNANNSVKTAIDACRITVYYTEASGGQAPRSMHQYRMRGS